MSIVEHPISQTGSYTVEGSVIEETRVFKMHPYDNSADAVAALLAAIPAIVPDASHGIPFSGFDWDEEGNGAWTMRVHYKNPSISGSSDANVLSFNTAGATQHISTSKELIAAFGMGGSSADGLTIGVGQPIGASADSVEGTDIPVPVFEFEIERTLPASVVDADYVQSLKDTTATTNAAAWNDFDEGHVLFLGAAGQQPGEGQPWRISFRFWAGSPSTGVTIGDISGISKKPWELFDVRYRKKVIGAGEDATIEMVPRLVLVHRVFDEGDFDLLQLNES